MKIGDLVKISENAKLYSSALEDDWFEQGPTCEQAKYGSLLDVTPNRDSKNHLYFTWTVLYKGTRVLIQEKYLTCDIEACCDIEV